MVKDWRPSEVADVEAGSGAWDIASNCSRNAARPGVFLDFLLLSTLLGFSAACGQAPWNCLEARKLF